LVDASSCQNFTKHYPIEKIKVILCHIKYKSLELSKNFSTHRSLFISRNPTDRVISHYNFFNLRETNIALEDLKTDELMNYVKKFKNVASSWISGSQTPSLDQVIKNLEEITYAGTLENFKKLLTHVAQTECKIREKDAYIPQIPHKNVGKKNTLTKETKDLIREMCEDSLDLKLHKHIIEKEKKYY